MSQGRFVAYYRVSTKAQGASGLGLEAQRKSVRDYLDGRTCALVSEFTEVESGRSGGRKELAKALAACRLFGARLIIAKLDRLARNVAFVSHLMESGVDFLAVDFPQANALTVHLLSAIAEHEREMISQRTKAALAAAQARGSRLGNPSNLRNRRGGHIQSIVARAAKASARVSDVMPVVVELRGCGYTSLTRLAAGLNERGIPAPRGGRWSAVQVKRVVQRAEADVLAPCSA